MYAAERSSRHSTCRIAPERPSASYNGRLVSPHNPKTIWTPCRRSISTVASAAETRSAIAIDVVLPRLPLRPGCGQVVDMFAHPGGVDTPHLFHVVGICRQRFRTRNWNE